ncbi:MAG TPA: hypothetical protein VJU81_21090, partial [Methylomirabilota bacterium]|nr:hypothetical protein [Methylomirabilota bacterium]
MAPPTKAELAREVKRLQKALARERAKQRRLEARLAESRRDLSEAGERQTATADVLHVIRQARADIQPVFETIADTSIRLFRAWSTVVYRFEGGLVRLVAARGGLPGSQAALDEL